MPRLFAFPKPPPASDRALVERFAADADPVAFTALVERHGPAVLAIGRRVGDAHLAEDVFQATFLLLARRAGRLRNPEAVGGWLIGVARKTAANARRRNKFWRAARRQPAGASGGPGSTLFPAGRSHRRADAAPLASDSDVELLLDELARLPDRYRSPLVACYLQSRTQPDAAADLGWSLSTLRRRLERGRELLRSRLLARGVTAAAGLLAVAPPLPAVPPELVAATTVVAADTLAGTPPPAHLAALTREGFPVTKLLLFTAVGLTAAGLALTPAADPKPVAKPAWVHLKGRVVVPADFKANAAPVNVTADKEHCLSGGPLKADDVQVNAKNRGLKNVWVYLRPDDDDRAKVLTAADAHASLQTPKPTEHAVDQPCCQFLPRILAVRAGDTIRFKNSSPIPHNVNANGFDAVLPQGFNVLLPPAGEKLTGPLTASRAPAVFKCDVHPWMSGMAMVFDHPYFALTDADGRFEIRHAPAKPLRAVYRHEHGFHKGKAGGGGFKVVDPTAIPAGTETPTVEVPELVFEFPGK